MTGGTIHQDATSAIAYRDAGNLILQGKGGATHSYRNVPAFTSVWHVRGSLHRMPTEVYTAIHYL